MSQISRARERKKRDLLVPKELQHPELFKNWKDIKQQNVQILGKADACKNGLQLLRPTVGVLVSYWTKQNNKILVKNMGTAFAVTPRIVLTCSHNIYMRMFKRYANEITFYPGVQSGSLLDKVKPIKGKPLINDSELSKAVFEVKPILEEFAIIYLDEPLSSKQELSFAKIGNFEGLTEWPEVSIIGYPTVQKVQQYVPVEVEKSDRFSQKGQVLEIQDFIIHYNIKTLKGVSGSPIIAFLDNGEPLVVGIHTHQGSSPDFNSGLYFYEPILAKMREQIEKLNNKGDEMHQIAYYSYHKQGQVSSQIMKGKQGSDDYEKVEQSSPSPKIEPEQQFFEEKLGFEQRERKAQVREEEGLLKAIESEKIPGQQLQRFMFSSESYCNKSAIINDYLSLVDDSFQNRSQISVFDDVSFSGVVGDDDSQLSSQEAESLANLQKFSKQSWFSFPKSPGGQK